MRVKFKTTDNSDSSETIRTTPHAPCPTPRRNPSTLQLFISPHVNTNGHKFPRISFE